MSDLTLHARGFSAVPIRGPDLVTRPQLQLVNNKLQTEIISLQTQLFALQAQSLTPVTGLSAFAVLVLDTSQNPSVLTTLVSDVQAFATSTQYIYGDKRLGIQGRNSVILPGHDDAAICYAFGDDRDPNIVYITFLDSKENLIEAVSYGLRFSDIVDALALDDQAKGLWISQGSTLNYFVAQATDSSKTFALPVGSSYVVRMATSGDRLFILDDNFALFAYTSSTDTMVCLLAGGPGNSGTDTSMIQLLADLDRMFLRLTETAYSEYSIAALMQNQTIPWAFTSVSEMPKF